MNTKDRLGLGASTERDGEMADIEQVAGWLYRHEMPNAARVVRGEVDKRNARIAELTAEVASLRSVVAPFADLAALFDDDMRGGNMPKTGEIMVWPRMAKEYRLTVEHLRDARNALKEGVR